MAQNKVRRKKKQLDPRWIIAGAVVAIVVLVALMFVFREDSSTTTTSASSSALPAPDFTVPSLDGDKLSLHDFRGQYVLVNFWASWCPPCKAEMPDLHTYYLEYKNKGFTLLAINVNDDPNSARAFIEANGFTFPVGLDTDGRVFNSYGGSALPTSFLIDPQGGLVKAWRPGAITRAMLDAEVTPRLGG